MFDVSVVKLILESLRSSCLPYPLQQGLRGLERAAHGFDVSRLEQSYNLVGGQARRDPESPPPVIDW